MQGGRGVGQGPCSDDWAGACAVARVYVCACVSAAALHYAGGGLWQCQRGRGVEVERPLTARHVAEKVDEGGGKTIFFGASKRDLVIIKPPTPFSVFSFSGGRVCTGVHACSGASHRPRNTRTSACHVSSPPLITVRPTSPPPSLCMGVVVSVRHLSLPHPSCLPTPSLLICARLLMASCVLCAIFVSDEACERKEER